MEHEGRRTTEARNGQVWQGCQLGCKLDQKEDCSQTYRVLMISYILRSFVCVLQKRKDRANLQFECLLMCVMRLFVYSKHVVVSNELCLCTRSGPGRCIRLIKQSYRPPTGTQPTH